MYKIAFILAVLCCIGNISGCGSSSTDTADFVGVNIQSDRFVPKNVTIRNGSSVQWVNVDSRPHQIVSGTLDPIGNPLVIRTITIGNTGFNPIETEANLGDTIRFNNLTTSEFILDIVDDDGNVVSTLVLQPGDLSTFDFPAAGKYSFRAQNNIFFTGSIILFGRPNPDGLFQSPVLNNGDTFLRRFTTIGSFPYFDLNQQDPDRSFMIGTVNVQ